MDNQLISIIYLLYSISPGQSFLVLDAGNDKIHDRDTLTDDYHFIPLGWPVTLDCIAARKYDKRTNKKSTVHWIIDGDQTLAGGVAKDYTYFLHKMDESMDKKVVECHFDSFPVEANRTKKGLIRIEVQDCQLEEGIDTPSHNRHDPCAYGQCIKKEGMTECVCFRQYTGRYCDEQKKWGFLFDFQLFYGSILSIILYIIYIYIVSWLKRRHKTPQLMNISGFLLPMDRQLLTQKGLYHKEVISSIDKAEDDKKEPTQQVRSDDRQARSDEKAKSDEKDKEKEQKKEKDKSAQLQVTQKTGKTIKEQVNVVVKEKVEEKKMSKERAKTKEQSKEKVVREIPKEFKEIDAKSLNIGRIEDRRFDPDRTLTTKSGGEKTKDGDKSKYTKPFTLDKTVSCSRKYDVIE